MSMAFYTQELRRAADPNSGGKMDMHVVWSESDRRFEHGPYQVAYCPRAEDAERIKDLLVFSSDRARVEAIHEFAGFLVGRKERSGPFSSSDDAAPMAALIAEFLKRKGWDD